MMFRSTARMAAMLAGCACAAGSAAQDSVSVNTDGGNGLPGDALVPWTIGAPFQRASYIVDLTPFETSWGTPLAIGPVMKASRTTLGTNGGRRFFTGLPMGTALSPTIRREVEFASPSYARWTAPGGGVHPTDNNTGLNTTINSVGTSSQFAVALLDVGVDDGGRLSNVLAGALINVRPSDPGRLYVMRIGAAVNQTGSGAPDRAQMGLGTVDANGEVYFRADAYNATNATSGNIPGNNILRVAMADRSAASANLLNNFGGTDSAATDWLVQGSLPTVMTPAHVPAELAGRGIAVGANFTGQWLSETAPNTVTSAATHRPGTQDHRGAPSVSPVSLLGGVATGAMITRSIGGANTNDSLSLWGISAGGAAVGAVSLTMPGSVSDSCDAFSTSGTLEHTLGQTPFRGGNGPVAVGRDAQGRVIAAAVIAAGAPGAPTNPADAIAVLRFDPANPTGTAQWRLAAWNNPVLLTGKPIRGDYGADGIQGTGDLGEGDGVINASDAAIGRLAAAFEVPARPEGPSMSAPGIDSAGNVYFLSAIRRLTSGAPGFVLTTGLIRAVYDPAAFCYQLDLMLEVGSRVTGANSGRMYEVQSLQVSDADSIASGSFWSSSVSPAVWGHAGRCPLDPARAENLAGLVLAAEITYDANNDGQFRDPTAVGGDTASPDETYTVALYITNLGISCAPDFDCDGFVTGLDFDAFVSAFEAGDSAADFDGDGFITGLDFDAYVAAFETGC